MRGWAGGGAEGRIRWGRGGWRRLGGFRTGWGRRGLVTALEGEGERWREKDGETNGMGEKGTWERGDG